MALRAFCDGAVFGHVHGSGAPQVLALHGWGRTGADFADVLDGFDAIALDLPGFGSTPPPQTAQGAHGYAEIVAGVLDAFDGPPVVLGHSFGGRVAVALQADRPASFRGAILTGVPLIRRRPARRAPMAYRLVRALSRWGLLSNERLEREKRKRGSADYRAATGVMRDVLVRAVNESYEKELRVFGAPVRLVWGRDDTEVPVWVAEQATSLLGDTGTLEIIEGAGHLIAESHVPVIRRVLGEML